MNTKTLEQQNNEIRASLYNDLSVMASPLTRATSFTACGRRLNVIRTNDGFTVFENEKNLLTAEGMKGLHDSVFGLVELKEAQ